MMTVLVVLPGKKPVKMELKGTLRNEAGEVVDILCGPFFVCGLSDEDFVSLTTEQLETYNKIFERPEVFLAVDGKLIVLPV